MEAWRAELYHHGIEGQRWGVRRGPPYPLSESARSSLRKYPVAGAFVRGGDDKKTAMDKAREKYAVIGDSGRSKSTVTKDAEAVALKHGFLLKKVSSTVGDDVKKTNPEYYEHQSDLTWLNNCTHSVVAFAARRRGLDVVATPMTQEQGKQGGVSLIDTCNWYFKGFKVSDVQPIRLNGIGGELSRAFLGIDVTRTGPQYEKKASAEMEKIYKDVPDGGYGVVQMATVYGGHVFVWYKEDGKIKFADSQGGTNAKPNFNTIAGIYGIPALNAVRLDNIELNPDRINEAIKNAPEEVKHGIAMKEVNALKMEPWRRELYMNELYHYGVKGMKWGVRRYQNKDGTLTAAGRKRKQSGSTATNDMLNRKAGSFRQIYGSDGKLTDEYKKKKQVYDTVNSYHESQQKYRKAVNQARQDSIDNFKNKKDNSTGIARETLNIGNESLKVYDRFASRRQKPLEDLSQISDKELQQRINRLNMEQQYHRLTASNEVSKGRQFAEDVLSLGGSALAVTSSALAIALSIKQLRGGV